MPGINSINILVEREIPESLEVSIGSGTQKKG